MTLDTSIECVLFDLDGTLVDTAPDFVIALNLLLAQHGKQALEACVISRTVSDGAKALVSLGFRIDDKAKREAEVNRLYDERRKLFEGSRDKFRDMDQNLQGEGRNDLADRAMRRTSLYSSAVSSWG